MRILIVKTTSMGDVVHALPVLADIHAAHPHAVIDWMVERPFDAIVRLHPAVDTVHVLAWRRWRKRLLQRDTWAEMGRFRRALRQHRYDLVLDLQGLIKSALWAAQAIGPRAGYDRRSIWEPPASVTYQRTAAVSKRLHAIERCRRLAAAHLAYALPLDLADTPPRFGLQAPPSSWPLPVAPYAVLNPNASSDAKLWPQASWIALGRALRACGLPVVVMWGAAAEQARAGEIADAVGGLVPPFLSIADAAAVLGGAGLVVGLDTGFTHLAAALGVATVGIYCDHHDPRAVGVTGDGYARSLGGLNRPPSLDDVLQAVLAAPGLAR